MLGALYPVKVCQGGSRDQSIVSRCNQFAAARISATESAFSCGGVNDVLGTLVTAWHNQNLTQVPLVSGVLTFGSLATIIRPVFGGSEDDTYRTGVRCTWCGLADVSSDCSRPMHTLLLRSLSNAVSCHSNGCRGKTAGHSQS